MDIGDKLSIRRACVKDADDIALLERDTFVDPLSLDGTKRVLEDENVCAYVATLGDSFVGYCIIHHAADEGELSTIAVKEMCRGQRIAQHLLETALQENNLIKNLFLEVRDSNKSAQALYFRMGFEEVGRRKAFYQNPVEDALLLALHI